MLAWVVHGARDGFRRHRTPETPPDSTTPYATIHGRLTGY